jgi:hypothetical protein
MGRPQSQARPETSMTGPALAGQDTNGEIAACCCDELAQTSAIDWVIIHQMECTGFAGAVTRSLPSSALPPPVDRFQSR